MEIGVVKSVRGSVIRLDGLPTAKIGDVIQNDQSLAHVSALLPTEVEAMVLSAGEVLPGETFRPKGRELSISAGDFLFGRVINPLGKVIDGRGPLNNKKGQIISLDVTAPGIAARRFIKEQLETGITTLDTLLPIGRGQRELILGDARSGKTGFLFDVIANQKDKNMICIYAAIGKQTSDVFDMLSVLEKNQSLGYTIIIAGLAADPAPLIFLTPRLAMALAGFFQKQGRDVLLILDDMGSHARAYREISLSAGRPPGREAYPGDIFYEHAHLLERAGCFHKTAGSGSITALPVMELGLTDFTGYIPTNLMAMTDGHLLFSADLYSQGRRPAIDLSLSVTRVGRQTQKPLQTSLAFKVRQLLAEADQLATLSGFSAELPPETQLLLKRKEMITEFLKHRSATFVPVNIQTILLALPFCGWLADKDEQFVIGFKSKFQDVFAKVPVLAKFTANIYKYLTAEELIVKLNELGPTILEAIKN